MGKRNYYTLATSLPALPYFERSQRLPINEVRLTKRMTMLEPEDLRIVLKITELLAWDRQSLEQTDRDVARLYGEIDYLTKGYPLISTLIETIMNQRTILAALRRRMRDTTPPGRHEFWGIGPWLDHIVHGWNHPDFMLAMVFPWIPKAREMLRNGQALDLQRLLAREGWRQADAVMHENPFTFEAIVAYLLKWGIIRTWLANDPAVAAERFKKLVLEVTGGQEQLVKGS